jgi:hypothetical protein
MSKPTALLVAGFPNTGTTITAMILGQHPAAFAAGELAHFPDKRHFADHNVCSCGGKVKDCAFWLDIRERYAAGPKDDARLYALIAEASGRDRVIDVAHDMERVEAVAANPRLDLKVIHMVRQRQAVLNSRLRRLYGRGIVSAYRPKRVQKIVKVGRRHQQFLGRMGKVRNRLGDTCLEVDYDALCSEPSTWLARIGGFLDLDLDTVAAGLEAAEPLARVPHLLRGNGRLRRLDSVVVRRDAGYEDELSPVDHWLYEVGARAARLGVAW